MKKTLSDAIILLSNSGVRISTDPSKPTCIKSGTLGLRKLWAADLFAKHHWLVWVH